MLLSRLKNCTVLLAAVLLCVGVWGYAAASNQDSARPAPAAQGPQVPASPSAFQIDLRIVRLEKHKRTVLSEPRLITREGMPASFSSGSEQVVDLGGGKIEELVVGPNVRLVPRCEKGDGVCLDMTVSEPTDAVIHDGDAIVQARSVRIIRKVRLGETVTARLKTDERTPTVLEVTATVHRAGE